MKDAPKTVASLFLGVFRAAALCGFAAFAISLSTPKLEAGDADSPAPRLVLCRMPEATASLSVTYRAPGFDTQQFGIFAKPYQNGTVPQFPLYKTSGKNRKGDKITATLEFGTTEVALTITEVPGPDGTNPYEVVIHIPFLKDLNGTKDGTSYVLNWGPMGGDVMARVRASEKKPPPELYNQLVSSRAVDWAMVSDSEGLMVSHDPRLAYDIESPTESVSIPFIRLRAKGPTGEDAATLRINLWPDPTEALGTPDVLEEEVRAICAPYLANSVEKSCNILKLKQPGGTAFYCVLSNAFPAASGGAPDSRYLMLGIFRIGHNVAYFIGKFSAKGDANFSMILDALGSISLMSGSQKSKDPAASPNSANPA